MKTQYVCTLQVYNIKYLDLSQFISTKQRVANRKYKSMTSWNQNIKIDKKYVLINDELQFQIIILKYRYYLYIGNKIQHFIIYLNNTQIKKYAYCALKE